MFHAVRHKAMREERNKDTRLAHDPEAGIDQLHYPQPDAVGTIRLLSGKERQRGRQADIDRQVDTQTYRQAGRHADIGR